MAETVFGNHDCLYIDGARHLRVASLHTELGKVLEKKGIKPDDTLTVRQFVELLDEVGENLYESAWNSMLKTFGKTGEVDGRTKDAGATAADS